MQVLVSRVHSDNRVQKGQTHLDGHPAVSTEVRPAARFGDRRRDGRCACKGARALCSLDRNRGGHHLQTDTLREWQACRHVPVPCVRLFPTSSTRSETKAAGVGNYAISVSGDTGTSLAELSRSDKRRALAANRLIAQSSQNDPTRPLRVSQTGRSNLKFTRPGGWLPTPSRSSSLPRRSAGRSPAEQLGISVSNFRYFAAAPIANL